MLSRYSDQRYLTQRRKSIFRGCLILFGVAVDSSTAMTMDPSASALPCPCCSFLSRGNFFLPHGINEAAGVKHELEGDKLPDIITAPVDAWKRILKRCRCSNDTTNSRRVFMVDTHGHPHLQREAQYADETDEKTLADSDGFVVSLTCAVSPGDWKDALVYASKSSYILPALGVHPWYLNDITLHNIENTDNIAEYLVWNWLSHLETHLSTHPHLLVGEIGLCKMARFVREFPKHKGGKNTALQLQKLVFRKQFDLAAKWSRPVTVHCVNAHGLFMEVMRDVLREAQDSSVGMEEKEGMKCWKKAFPPAIAMHSFTGTAHHVSEILALERHILSLEEEIGTGGKNYKRRQELQPVEIAITETVTQMNNDDQTNFLFYFGFSHSVNYLMCTSERARKKGLESVRSVPCDRLLVESDVHTPGDVVLGTAGSVAYVAHARGEPIEDVAQQTRLNGLRFLNCLGSIT